MTLGEATMRARIMKGVSVKEMSEKTGISQMTIRNMENGKNVPSILYAEAMADVLGISIDEYIGHKVGVKK